MVRLSVGSWGVCLQLGQVLGSLLSQPIPAAGLPVVLEVGVAAGGLDASVAAQISSAIREIKAKSPIPVAPTPGEHRKPHRSMNHYDVVSLTLDSFPLVLYAAVVVAVYSIKICCV